MTLDQLTFVKEYHTMIFCVKYDVAIRHHLDLIVIFSGHPLNCCMDEFFIFKASRSSLLSGHSILLLKVMDEIGRKLLSVGFIARWILLDLDLIG